MVSIEELYWAAGFLEGEGAFMSLHNRRRINKFSASFWMPVVDCSQVNPEPLDKLKALFGGKIVNIKQSGNRSQARCWRLYGRAGIGLMMTLWTLMSQRRRAQIELAIERWKSNKGLSGEEFIKSRARGSENGNSKLTAEIVREIRLSSESGKKLAKKYSVSDTTIENVRNRKVWAHVDDNRSIA